MALSLFDLSGRKALVTGASRGIGFSIATGLGRAGASVVLNGRDVATLDRAVATLREEGIDAAARPFDVTEPDAVETAVAAIEAEGPIDILVNNAGVQKRQLIVDLSVEDWRRVVETNLDAVFVVGQAVARRMLTRRAGKIINICSLTSEVGRATIAPYSASKGAVKMLTKTMCAEWARHGIQVNGIGPGWFKTELNRALVEDPAFTTWLEARAPIGRWGELEELQGAAIFLASPASSYVNGHVLYVDGGVTAVV